MRGGLSAAGRASPVVASCGESGLCLRMFSAIAALLPVDVELRAEGSLASRSVAMVADALDRITSYNVCYTKLLRALEGRVAELSAERDAAVATRDAAVATRDASDAMRLATERILEETKAELERALA